MIKYDYLIKRDEGDETKDYKPSMPKELQDLTIIAAPNSSGKSTLLNLVALGLYGNKNSKIRESLRSKIDNLIKSDHQQLSYNYSIKNEISNIEIISEKKISSRDTVLYEVVNGKKSPLSSDLFNRKYNLIYDIPENPLERLYELTNELKDNQLVYARIVQKLSSKVREYISQVQESRDPKKIEHQKNLHANLIKESAEKQNEKINLEKELIALTKYYHTLCFDKFYNQYLTKKEELSNLRGQVRKQKKEIRLEDNELERLTRDSSSLLIKSKSMYSDVSNSLSRLKIKTEENYLTVWNKNDLKKLLQNNEMRKYIFDGIKEFKEKLNQIAISEIDRTKLTESNILKEMIQLLERYTSDNIIIPGIDKHVNELKLLLLDKYRSYERITITQESYDKLINSLEELKNKSSEYVTMYEKLFALNKNRVVDDESIEEEDYEKTKLKLQDEISTLEAKIEYHRDELIKMDVKENEITEVFDKIKKDKYVQPFIIYGPKELREKLDGQKQDIEKITTLLKEVTFRLSRVEQEISRLENKEEHRYQNYENELNILLNNLVVLEQKLTIEFDEYLKNLKKVLKDKKQISASAMKYYEAIASYLAKKLKVVRHINVEYNVQSIDLINKVIKTEQKKNIKFDDFGTGQSQSAYLISLLNSSDQRKIIALLDEVAMLDEKSLSPVLELIRKQYKNGKLLSALVVQKSEEIKIKSFIGGI